MTQEQKELLLKITQERKQLLGIDISARITYGLLFNLNGKTYPLYKVYNDGSFLLGDEHSSINGDNAKPYLRPLSSMTEEEWKNFRCTLDGGDCEINDDGETGFIMLWFEPCQLKSAYNCLDYLNSIHIDYRGLIPMGLALEAPEGMYNN